MENKKQTAIEFLGHELNVKLFYNITPELWEQVNEIFKQAKAMHKEEIINSFFEGAYGGDNISGEQYYTETYGGNK